jgi:hypothetical protein
MPHEHLTFFQASTCRVQLCRMDRDDNVRHQNDLINQRLTWLGTFEGLLFVADHYAEHPYLLPLVGLAIAVVVDVGIRAANDELTKLNAQPHRGWNRELMPGVAIPKIIGAAWLIILLRVLWFSLMRLLFPGGR